MTVRHIILANQSLYNHRDIKKSIEQINNIYHTLYDIFERSAFENIPPNEIAEKIARDRLQ